MATVDDFLVGDGFGFSHVSTFTRRRAGQKTNPYDPDETVEDWDNAEELGFEGYWASQSSLEQSDAVRAQIVTTKQIVITEPDFDIRAGDRVVAPGGGTYRVTGFPGADMNPFTGWQPTLVVNVEEATG
jgi:hypothetical protein